jgi:Fe-S-cluster-containing hydrogenase component 2
MVWYGMSPFSAFHFVSIVLTNDWYDLIGCDLCIYVCVYGVVRQKSLNGKSLGISLADYPAALIAAPSLHY